MSSSSVAASPGPGPGLSLPARAARVVGAGLWLFYLGQPLGRLLDVGGWERWLGLLGLAAFVVLYLGGLAVAGVWRFDPGRTIRLSRRWALVAALLVCAAATVPGAGDKSLTCLVFVSALAMASLPTWYGVGTVLVLLLSAEAAGWLVPGWSADGNGLGVVLAALAVWAFRMAGQRQQALLQAERELADSAVEQERSRIDRDLHDILGHSLTVVAVKAELAQRLLDVDQDRARAELADLERLTRDALADVRSTALGMRGISLPGEIAAARTALESAGVKAILPTVADEVPSRWRELFAWTIRESVTNVIRHSGATTCTIDITPRSVSVVDDGRGCTSQAPAGHGLDGLAQRSKLAGAVAATGPGQDGTGFRVQVMVPA